MVWPTLETSTAKEQNRTCTAAMDVNTLLVHGVYLVYFCFIVCMVASVDGLKPFLATSLLGKEIVFFFFFPNACAFCKQCRCRVTNDRFSLQFFSVRSNSRFTK